MTSLSLNNKVRQRPYSSVIKIIKILIYMAAAAAASTEETSCFTSGTERLFTTMLLIPSAAYVYTIKTLIMHKKISSAMEKQTSLCSC
jgi:hypothetical protein